MTCHKRWLVMIPLLILGVSTVTVHRNIGQDEETKCMPDAPDASLEVNVLDVEELLAEYALAVNTAHVVLEQGRWADAVTLTPPPGAFAWSRFPQAWAATYVARAIGAARMGEAARARQELEQLQLLRHTLLANGVCDWAYEVEIRHRVAAAWVANAEGNPEEALQLVRSAADLEARSPKHPMLTPPIALAHESLGELLLAYGEPRYALQAFETALREYPRRLTALYGAALASELSGDQAKAQAFSRQFVKGAERVASDSSKLARAKTFLTTGHVEP